LGGAAGLFAGHKVNHGILGTVGGAIAGSLLEDQVKKHESHGLGDGLLGRHHEREGHHHHHHDHRHHSHSRSRSRSGSRSDNGSGFFRDNSRENEHKHHHHEY